MSSGGGLKSQQTDLSSAGGIDGTDKSDKTDTVATDSVDAKAGEPETKAAAGPVEAEAAGPVETEAAGPAEVEVATETAADRGPGAWIVLIFTVLSLVAGSAWALTAPPFWGHDEITQFGRAYQVSEGGFLPTEIDDDRGVAYGADLPVEFSRLMGRAFDDYTGPRDETEPMAPSRGAYTRLENVDPSDQRVPVWFTNTAAYSPVAYGPSAAALIIARAVDASVGTTVLMTRLAGVLAYTLLGAIALWVLRRRAFAWVPFTVAMLPIAAFQAGTITADTLTNALALLVSALVVKALFYRDRLGRVETVLLGVGAVALPLCKPSYILLPLLAVLIPAALTAWPRLRRLPIVLPVLTGLVLFGLWTRVSAGTTEGMSLMRRPEQWHTVIPTEQMAHVLADPLGFGETFVRTVLLRDQLYFVQFFGELGFGYVNVPAVSIVAAIIGWLVAMSRSLRPGTPRWVSAICFLALLLTSGMIFGTLYLSFTPVDFYIIDGVQGRYFMPLAVLASAVLLAWFGRRQPAGPGRVAAVVIVGSVVIAQAAALAKYGYVVWGALV